MIFDWTVHADTMLMLAGFIFAGGGLWREVRAQGLEVRDLKEGLKVLTGVLVDVAKQEQRLDDHDRRLGQMEGQR